MKNVLSILFALMGLSAMAQENVINDKNAQVRTVSGFSAIKVSGAIDLYLSQGSEAVAVSASETSDRDKIKTEVKNGVLEIWYEHEKLNFKNNGNKKLKAYVSFKNLNKLNASGASDIVVSGTMNVNSLKMDLSGASDFKGTVQITDLDIIMSGASDVNIEGVVTNLKVNASGASDLKGYKLTSEECDVDASGASDINITVNKSLTAEATGASSIHYKGNAVVKKVNTSGASSIKKT